MIFKINDKSHVITSTESSCVKNGEYIKKISEGCEIFNYKDGVLHGKYQYLDKNNRPLEICHYIDGKLHGVRMTFYDNNQIKTSSEYANGKLSGNYRKWSRDGILRENKFYTFVNNKLYSKNLMINVNETNEINETKNNVEYINQYINSVPYTI